MSKTRQFNSITPTRISQAIGIVLLGLGSTQAGAGQIAAAQIDKGHNSPNHICGTDENKQNWRQLQKDNAKALNNPFSPASTVLKQAKTEQADIKATGNGVAGRYYIPTVIHVYGNRFNCTNNGGMCLSDAEILDALNKTNEDFLGLNTQDGPIAAEFQAIRQNLNIEFVLAKKDPNGNPTNGIVRYGEKSGYGDGSAYDSQIAADSWDNFKYANVYIMQDLYADGATTNSGVAWYPQLSMSQAGLARVVYNGDYLAANTSENFRSVFTHEFGHWLNLPHTFDGDTCSVHQAAFCSLTGDNVCDTPQMSSSILQDNAPNCMGKPTNTENFMHYSDNYAMFTQGQVDRMTAALHGPSRATLWTNANLIATGLEEYTSNADHPWDGSTGLDQPPTGQVIASWENLSAPKGQVDNYQVNIPAGTEAVAFYLDGYSEDPDMYVKKGQAPTNNGGDWDADFISFKSTGTPELVAITAPDSSATYHTAVDAFTAYSNARLQVLGVEDPSLCNGCERVFALEDSGLSSAKGATPKTYSVQIPSDATKTIVVMPGGYQGDPDLYASVNAIPTTSVADCKPFSAPRLSEYCELPAGGGTVNIMIDPFLEYSGASIQVYYERAGSNSGLPTANANGPYSADANVAISFSSAGSADPDGTITSYAWNFGDGNSSTQANPSHTYTTAGQYTATLTVTDNDGQTATSNAQVTIYSDIDQLCTATGNTGYEWISQVQVGSFSNSSNKEGYGDFTNLTINLKEGDNSINLTAGGGYTEHWAAWIDLNQDGAFSADEKVLSGLSGQNTVTGNLVVPAGHIGQERTMRIVMKYGSEAASPCGSIGDGEVEDYRVTISEGDNNGGGNNNGNVPDACATEAPRTDGRLEDGVPVCLGSSSTIWLSMADVASHGSISITTAHGTGNLDLYYKNGGWPSESDNDGSSTNADNSECIHLTNATDYWSYFKITGGATGATIVADFDAAGCR